MDLKYRDLNLIKCVKRDTFNDILDKFRSEKINLSFSKSALSAHRKAQNTKCTVVWEELGRLPLGIDIIANVLLYYNHLKAQHYKLLTQRSIN